MWGTALIVLVGLLLLVAASSDFLDVAVYEWAGRAVVEGRPLYEPDGTVLPFVYPPFAALVFVPLAVIPAAAPAVLTLVSLAALGAVAWLLADGIPLPVSWRRSTRAAALFTLLLVLEPSVETLRLGQVSLLLLGLVVTDFCRPASVARGAWTGFATALKIVPGFFLVFYAVVGRWRHALVGAATFVVLTAVAWLVLPGDSARYWLSDLLQTDRLGAPIGFVGNQSLLAMWTRTTGSDPGDTWAWRVAMVAVVAGGLGGCWLMWRRQLRMLSFGLAGLVSLLVSPASWTHHWVFLFPLLVALAGATAVRRWLLVVVAVDWLVLLSRVVWRAPRTDVGVEPSLVWWPVANAYVLAGLLAGAAAVVVLARTPRPDRLLAGPGAA